MALPEGGYYFEMSRHPLADATIQDLEAYPWPDPRDPGRVEGMREYYRRIHEDTQFAILTKFGGAIFEQAWYLRGMERFFTDMLENPAFARALLEKICQIQMGLDEAGIQAVGEYVDILRLSGEDMGTQEGPLILLRMFRDSCVPISNGSGVSPNKSCWPRTRAPKIMLHSCGAIPPSSPIGSTWGWTCWTPSSPMPKVWILLV